MEQFKIFREIIGIRPENYVHQDCVDELEGLRRSDPDEEMQRLLTDINPETTDWQKIHDDCYALIKNVPGQLAIYNRLKRHIEKRKPGRYFIKGDAGTGNQNFISHLFNP